jgi:hypothetical protein
LDSEWCDRCTKTLDGAKEALAAYDAQPDAEDVAGLRAENERLKGQGHLYAHMLKEAENYNGQIMRGNDIIRTENATLRSQLSATAESERQMAAELQSAKQEIESGKRLIFAVRHAMGLMAGDDLLRRVINTRSEIASLQRWKAEQLAVERSWDDQEVAKLLGIPPGAPIRENIAPKIKQILDEQAAFLVESVEFAHRVGEIQIKLLGRIDRLKASLDVERKVNLQKTEEIVNLKAIVDGVAASLGGL